MTVARKILFIFLALTLLVAGMGFNVQSAQAAACTQWHTVRWGETLARIGRQYGVSWQTLAKWNGIANPNKIYAGQVLCVSVTSKPKVVPTFSITAVVRDTSASILTANFPANDTFDVYMNYYGTLGINGIKVGTLTTGDGGALAATFNIPAKLAGNWRLAIRLHSPTSGNYAYNWFYNNTTGKVVVPGYQGIPTFSIVAVVKDTSVTITTKNFPKNVTFDILMGAYGTLGIGGTKVGTLDSGAGGSLTATYKIPAALQGKNRIAIRAQSASGFFAYNWFWNATAP